MWGGDQLFEWVVRPVLFEVGTNLFEWLWELLSEGEGLLLTLPTQINYVFIE